MTAAEASELSDDWKAMVLNGSLEHTTRDALYSPVHSVGGAHAAPVVRSALAATTSTIPAALRFVAKSLYSWTRER